MVGVVFPLKILIPFFFVLWTSLQTISGLVPTIVDQNMNIDLVGSGTTSISEQAHQSVKWNCIAF
jgi:hypothetical protein